ncbi:hypothetical protein GLOTRDRAFT_124944 [Gloeophyllum trabeum ATCC 11539]|uniref:Uncharacterized protein n=1 Tax=Gloeophyllum trabeum (strain ATCC 11539 / FP-39264 / Madison 617) TaxID=670483 RepID=S7S5G2_GLOTA|nr:uncharacterized protein GLOTRDRAFT_124944 [Gloeophyllum trabeum ATCC 11539]EPQ61214.1 hypothetical protein GLOTRDRAFT_124944 [Gloeophyllum trabeum ATCC 11539]
MGGLTTQQNYLLCICLESALYAFYVGAFGYCMRVLSTRNSGSRTNTTVTFIVVLLFFMTTAEFVIDAYVAGRFNLSDAYYDNTPHALLEHNLHDLLYCIYDGIFGINIFLADALVVWRCSVVWNKRWFIIAIPIVALIVEISLGISVLVVQGEHYLLRLHTLWGATLPDRWTQLGSLLSRLNIAYYVTTFILNAGMTILVSSRIAWVVRKVQKASGHTFGSRYIRAVRILIESGLIYAALLLLAMAFQNDTVGDIASVLLVMSTGLVPTLVLTLIALGKSTEHVMQVMDHSAVTTLDGEVLVEKQSRDEALKISATIENPVFGTNEVEAQFYHSSPGLPSQEQVLEIDLPF